MTDINEDPPVTPQASTISLTGAELHAFTDEASTAYLTDVDRYAQELKIRARRRTQGERVLKADVDDAATELRPNPSEPWRTWADWARDAGFLFFGLAIGQAVAVTKMETITLPSVWWLVGLAGAAASLVTVGVLLSNRALRRIS